MTALGHISSSYTFLAYCVTFLAVFWTVRAYQHWRLSSGEFDIDMLWSQQRGLRYWIFALAFLVSSTMPELSDENRECLSRQFRRVSVFLGYFVPFCFSMFVLLKYIEASHSILSTSEAALRVIENDLPFCSHQSAPADVSDLPSTYVVGDALFTSCRSEADRTISAIAESNSQFSSIGLYEVSLLGLLAIAGMLEGPHIFFKWASTSLPLARSEPLFTRRCHLIFLLYIFYFAFIVRVGIDAPFSVFRGMDFMQLATRVISPLTLDPDRYLEKLMPYTAPSEVRDLLALAERQRLWLNVVAAQSAVLVICVWEIIKENVFKPVMNKGFRYAYINDTGN
ncbi:hypothetical protein WN982_19700 [Paraburkholderia sp. IMGN_8]|uniref:hypothetical protein n=1 Tax=Paraburkholderia sp. IMGN_8 TaxID=3136564 RepID=UPI0031010D48